MAPYLTLTAVTLERARRFPRRWVAMYSTGRGGFRFITLPFTADTTTREQAAEYAAAHPVTWDD